MKNLLILLLSITFTIAVSAQVEEGSRMIGGNLLVDLAFDSDDDVFEFDFNPSYGLFIRDKLAVGGTLGIGYVKAGDLKTTSFSIGPFTRWYLLGEGELKLFLHGQLEYFNLKNDDGTDDIKSNGFGVFAGPGVSYFITDEVSVDITLGYNYIDFGDDVSSSNLRLLAGLQIFL